MLIGFNNLKTFYHALTQKMKDFRGNWNQNDPTADDYIKNRPFYSECIERTITLVDNLKSEHSEEELPRGSFVLGNLYDVTWNGTLYKDLICHIMNDYRVIGGTENEPFCIIDTNGEGLYTLTNDETWTLSITYNESSEIVHKIDKKFINLPNDLVTEDFFYETLDNYLAPVAFTNDYKSLSGKPTIYTNVIRYDTKQSLSDQQKAIAKENIGVTEFSGDYLDLINKPCYEERTFGEEVVMYDGVSAQYSYFSSDIELRNLVDYHSVWKDTVYGDNSKWEEIIQSDGCIVQQKSTSGAVYKTHVLPARYITKLTSVTNNRYLNVNGVVFGNISLLSGLEEDNTNEDIIVFMSAESNKPCVVSIGDLIDVGVYESIATITPYTAIYHKLNDNLLPNGVARLSDIPTSETIRGELTKADVTTALGYTPPTNDRTMVREFDTGIMDGTYYTTSGDLAKFYIVTVNLTTDNTSDEIELTTFTFDYMACRALSNTMTQRIGNVAVKMDILDDGTVSFFCSSGSIKHICGYY